MFTHQRTTMTGIKKAAVPRKNKTVDKPFGQLDMMLIIDDHT